MKQRERNAIIRQVAEYVRDFDHRVLHPWRLSDCILTKFNIAKKRPRRNYVEWLTMAVVERGKR